MKIGHTHPAGESGNLGSFPHDGKENGRVAKDAEIVPVMRVLPDVLS